MDTASEAFVGGQYPLTRHVRCALVNTEALEVAADMREIANQIRLQLLRQRAYKYC